jgi:hypothetical protein
VLLIQKEKRLYRGEEVLMPKGGEQDQEDSILTPRERIQCPLAEILMPREKIQGLEG